MTGVNSKEFLSLPIEKQIELCEDEHGVDVRSLAIARAGNEDHKVTCAAWSLLADDEFILQLASAPPTPIGVLVNVNAAYPQAEEHMIRVVLAFDGPPLPHTKRPEAVACLLWGLINVDWELIFALRLRRELSK